MIWLRLDQLKNLGVSKGILHRNRANWTFRPTRQRGRNGRVVEEVLLESLPVDYQRKYLKLGEDEHSSLTTEMFEPDEDRPSGDAPHGSGAGGDGRLTEALKQYSAETRDAFQAEALRLSSIVDRYDEIRPKRQRQKAAAGAGFEYVPEVLALCEEAVCADRAVLAVERKRGKAISPHTLEAWSKKRKTLGLAAFLRKPPEQNATVDKRKAAISAEAIEWMNANWRRKPSPWALHKALTKEAAKKGWTIPAYGWVYRKYQSLDKIVTSAVFNGAKDYANKWGVYVPRTVEDLGALQILCGDHSVRDVMVMLPDGRLTRPWLTLWQCLRTGLLWGWHLDLKPSSNTIGLAYVNGVQNFGAQPVSRPDDGYVSYLYTDQGKDYKSKMLLGHTLEFKEQNYGRAGQIGSGLEMLCTQRQVGFMNELGIKHIMARGYNAKEKAVERVHADISRWEQNHFENEYCGRGTEHKPDGWVAAWHRHQRLLKKFPDRMDIVAMESPFITFDDYREALATGFINEYNHEAHKRTVLNGAKVVPIDEFNRLYTTRYNIADETLALLLMKTTDKPKAIGKNGITMLNGLFWHEAFSRFKGEEVEVRYSDNDYERIYAVLPDKTVVEASNLRRSSIVNPNKRTHEIVAKARANESKIIRDARLIEQSNWRGETTEDRVAALINPEDTQPPQREKIAVNDRPTVHVINRMDHLRTASSRPNVSAEQIETAKVIPGMFGADREKKRIKEEWED